VLVMVPAAALPPSTPSTDHVTARFVVPVTVAVNCCVALAATEIDTGATETDTPGGVEPTVIVSEAFNTVPVLVQALIVIECNPFAIAWDVESVPLAD
jgi:hypothetical protein